MSEEPGKPTASELFERNRERDRKRGFYGWEAFCVVGDYCTRPCVECSKDAARYQSEQKGRTDD